MALTDYKTKEDANQLISEIEQGLAEIESLEATVKEPLNAIEEIATPTATDVAVAFNALIADLKAKGYMANE